MKVRTLLATLTLAGACAVTLKVTTHYQNWKQEVLDGLQIHSRMCNTANGPIEYSIQGNGKGPVVLIAHGSPGGFDQGAALATLFKNKNITTISVSRPGYLRTPLTYNETPEAQADLYAALLQKLEIEQVTMLGVSGGGPSAILFAARHPECCSGLVLLCAISKQYSEREQKELWSPDQRLIRPLVENLLYLNTSPFPIFLIDMLDKQSRTSVPNPFIRTLAFYSLRKAGDRNDMQQFERIQDYPLARITVPTLVMQGNADTNLSVEHAKYAAAHIPNARLVIDEGGDHFFFIAHKEKIMPIIEAFVGA